MFCKECGAIFIELYVAVARDKVFRLSFYGRFDDKIGVFVRADIYISGEQGIFRVFVRRVSSSSILSSVSSYLLFIFGRLRTSVIFSSKGSEIMTWKTPSSNAFRNMAGRPVWLRSEDTRTLVNDRPNGHAWLPVPL